ncbi:hypothetical protein [Amycolatopsis suaedae]|uniref:GerMN domain-containing protein n=1 Tax=Amycolatopsis suaedae TaxID=2510978 RepID=A0A4Q7JD12_9PSEU|nr:hypothetical protein [Amycolatopsis suaedae]RZQ65791.1 hypothetical protein EWH70_01520 [Amycolatopsis suaedae]
MRRLIILAALVTAGCGIQPTGVLDGGEAPTGVAPGVTLYFVDGRGELRPNLTESGELGDVAGALDLLLRTSDPPGLRSDLRRVSSLGPKVTVAGDTITVALPLAPGEVGPRGVDQVTCTAAGVRRQAGAREPVTVVVSFTDGSDGGPRTCPPR